MFPLLNLNKYRLGNKLYDLSQKTKNIKSSIASLDQRLSLIRTVIHYKIQTMRILQAIWGEAIIIRQTQMIKACLPSFWLVIALLSNWFKIKHILFFEATGEIF